jgi:hypothetical protein
MNGRQRRTRKERRKHETEREEIDISRLSVKNRLHISRILDLKRYQAMKNDTQQNNISSKGKWFVFLEIYILFWNKNHDELFGSLTKRKAFSIYRDNRITNSYPIENDW